MDAEISHPGMNHAKDQCACKNILWASSMSASPAARGCLEWSVIQSAQISESPGMGAIDSEDGIRSLPPDAEIYADALLHEDLEMDAHEICEYLGCGDRQCMAWIYKQATPTFMREQLMSPPSVQVCVCVCVCVLCVCVCCVCVCVCVCIYLSIYTYIHTYI